MRPTRPPTYRRERNPDVGQSDLYTILIVVLVVVLIVYIVNRL